MKPIDEAEERTAWEPPYVTRDNTDLDCPLCGAENAVMVREKDIYRDGEEVEAYCSDCLGELNVYASVDVAFTDPESSVVDQETFLNLTIDRLRRELSEAEAELQSLKGEGAT